LSEEPRFYGITRTVCDVLDDMRSAVKTLNFSYMLGCIEEVQRMANRMEAGLQDKKDLIELAEERSELKREVFELREEVAKQRLLLGKITNPKLTYNADEDKIVMTNEEWIEANFDRWEENL